MSVIVNIKVSGSKESEKQEKFLKNSAFVTRKLNPQGIFGWFCDPVFDMSSDYEEQKKNL